MKTKKRSPQKRTSPNLRIPDGKLNFFNESNEMYPPMIQGKDKVKKEIMFVVDWQLSDSNT